LRWSAYQYTKLTNAFVEHLYFNDNVNHYSTVGLGTLGNQAQQKARGIVKSKKTNEKENNHKKSIPNLSKLTCFANIQKQSSSSHFNYRVKQINKTVIKQLLDKEAKRMIARGSHTSSNLIVEDPKVLANLRGSKGLRRWARTYFAYRLKVLGKENGVLVVFIHPAYTSISCPKCKSEDKENRKKLLFHCLKCGHKDHADINGTVNLSLKGQEPVDKHILPSFLKKLNKSRPVMDFSDSGIAEKQH